MGGVIGVIFGKYILPQCIGVDKSNKLTKEVRINKSEVSSEE